MEAQENEYTMRKDSEKRDGGIHWNWKNNPRMTVFDQVLILSVQCANEIKGSKKNEQNKNKTEQQIVRKWQENISDFPKKG